MTTKTYINRVFIATVIVFSIVGLLGLIGLAREPLLWIGIAAFFAVAINPIVHKVARFMPKKSITLATLAVLSAGIGVLALLAYLFLAPLIQQTTSLIASIPELVQKAASAISSTPFAHNINLSQSGINNFIQDNISQLLASASVIGGVLISVIASTVNSIIALIAIISLVFFMSAEGKNWKEATLRAINPKSRNRAAEIGHQVYTIITGYVVGNLILSVIFGVSGALVLWLMGSPYWLPLGLAAGLIDLIPLVGSTIAAILVAVISLLSGQMPIAVVFIIFTILYVQLENNVLNPAVYSKSVDVSPLIVLISILLGAAMAGVIGALLAIPVAATIQVIVRELLRSRTENAS